MLYCFAPNNINLSSFVNECIKHNVEKVFLMENKKNGMSLVVQREKFYLLTRGGGVAKYSKLVNVKKLMESGGVYMIYDKSKGKSVAMDYVSLWIKDEERLEELLKEAHKENSENDTEIEIKEQEG